jgi:hypothetical protein
MDAVAVRLGGRERELSFLSGGLDSRCIVSALRSLDLAVVTFNFSPPNTLDEVLAARFAERAGTTHHSVNLDVNAFNAAGGLPAIAARALGQLGFTGADRRAPQIWSGDGGSVGLGFVYMNDAMADACADGDIPRAAREYLKAKSKSAAPRIFHKNYQDFMAKLLEDSVLEQLNIFKDGPQEKTIYFFLMYNDQRRHLRYHFEDIDIYRFEPLIPFYDRKFLTVIAQIPMRRCLYHKFYSEFFERFPNFAREIPWQTYPGHVPCPLDMPEGLQWQFTLSKTARELRQGRKLAADLARLAVSAAFPARLLRRSVALTAALCTLSGIKDASHLVRRISAYYRYYRLTNRQINLS